MPLLSNATIKPPEYATRPLTTVLESYVSSHSDSTKLTTHPTRLLIPALIICNIPQYIYLVCRGPGIISPWYIILLLLFSTVQITSRIYSPELNPRLLFVRDAPHCSSWMFPSILDYIPIGTQWICVLIF